MAVNPVPTLGELPTWSLDDLYPGRESVALAADLEWLSAETAGFVERYRGKVGTLTGAGLAEAIARYERLSERSGRLSSYGSLLYAGDQADPGIGQFTQTLNERLSLLGSETLFFTLEINAIPDETLAALLATPALARYRPWLDQTRAWRPHQLSDELERMLYEKWVTGGGAWSRLFDETVADLRFPVEGRSLTSAEALNLLSDRDPARRRAAAESLSAGLGGARRTFALILNTLAKDKAIEDRWRHYPQPISARNLANQVEDEVVDALLAAARRAAPETAHRYYRLKARWLGQSHLNHWDRNAPLPQDDDAAISWDEARETVLGAYHEFSPRMAEIARGFFDRGWIDAAMRPGKSPGAFAHPTVPSAHPYILLNYQGRARDVMTLAHELGHGVHQVLAGGQGYLQSGTALTLAETASVFGEMLTFRRLLDRAPPARRRIMLARKVEDMINTVIRQTAFCEFERRFHDERLKGEVLAERIGEIWLEVQRESLGDAFNLDPGYAVYWSYIPHFVHTPFYVYAYAFGDCLVNSLYAVFQQGDPGFADRYLDLLAAGGTKRHRELLAPFGLNAADPDFWDRGLGLLRQMIDELEAIS